MRISTGFRLVTALTLAATLTGAGVQAAGARQSLSWENVSQITETDDESPGAMVGEWFHSAYDTGSVEIVLDSSSHAQGDGAAELSLPTGPVGDAVYVSLEQSDGPDKRSGIRYDLADFSGSYALQVVSGPPAAYHLEVDDCVPDDPTGVTLTYAGPFPDGWGWHTIDVSRDDRALWTSDEPVGDLEPDTPYRLARLKAQCPDGVIAAHGFTLEQAPGADSLVDAVTFMDRATNFRMPPPRDLYVHGTSGDDRLFGLAGDDLLRGRAGHDVLNGRGGADRVYGGPGADRVGGGTGRDHLYGGDGRDTLRPGKGADIVYGGAGRDTVVLGRDHRRDRVYCGAGRDRVEYLHRRDRSDRLFRCERVVTHTG